MIIPLSYDHDPWIPLDDKLNHVKQIRVNILCDSHNCKVSIEKSEDAYMGHPRKNINYRI
jgi:hypothetical protein